MVTSHQSFVLERFTSISFSSKATQIQSTNKQCDSVLYIFRTKRFCPVFFLLYCHPPSFWFLSILVLCSYFFFFAFPFIFLALCVCITAGAFAHFTLLSFGVISENWCVIEIIFQYIQHIPCQPNNNRKIISLH